ncbi:BLUF domain-containing protein [Roseibium sediminis]|uniref:BLUF domain-containing protein n=1 Tax=Roseibium sediminis TaxID=1775174 RepID=UPI00123DA073|nr:BLUF domain-containing protein [Roseibium sediminis]
MYLMRLTYYSSPSITMEHGGRTNALKDILAASRRNNADSGITGTLFFNDEYFAQVIEGDREQVSDSFIRISRDERHRNIIVLRAQSIHERLFNGWEMGFASITENTEMLYRKYSSYSEFKPSRMTADGLEALLVEMVHHTSVARKQTADQAGSRDISKVRKVKSL